MARVLVMVGTQKGAFFFWSDEQRKDWRLMGPFLKGWEVLDLTIDQRQEPSVIYAALGHFLWGTTIHVSHDLGQSWTRIDHGPQFRVGSERTLKRVWCVTVGHPDEPGVLFSGVSEAALFVSRDGGSSWQEMETLSNHPTRPAWIPGLGDLCCHTVLVDPTDKDRMWVAISAAGVFRTDDGGETWAVKNEGLPLTVPSADFEDMASCPHHMVLAPTSPNVLYMQHHQGVFRSTDGADNWERCQEGLPSEFGLPMAVHPHDSKTAFVSPVDHVEYRLPIDGQLTIYRTRDGGETWQPQTKGLPGNHYGGLLRRSITTDTYEECGIYFGTTSGEIFYSLDGGESWQKMPGYGALPRVLSVSTAIID